ncbi:MAG: polymerase subunit gamma/tau [Acidobacteriota bacterium]|jgi:DNA polymerase-3 subunit gamma/tau|nr:polymerase subunit gamma/tau [Acidobacteriota bacterium]
MSYQVIARKWRPQTFEEVTGQEHITRTLRNAVEHERLHHAYLFSGARGVGKTTTARLLAKAVNCHRSDRPTPVPCRTTDADACPSCREIAEGGSMDVLEIDAASHTGVDNVRDTIIETVNKTPARDRYRVFIIDEVHMLSTAAFNALLKTLEEPPPRVLFIMATTHPHKVPETILSRSQQFEFRTIAAAKIAERLRIIADAEKIKVSEEALREVARAGEGSMRDAQSAFDQVISFSEGKIETADVEAALGIAGRELLARVMRSVAAQKPADALAVVDELAARGHELRNFCRDLLAHLRDMLVVKVAGDAAMPDATEVERKELLEESRDFSESDLVRFFHSLTETEGRLRESAHPRYQLEVGLVKLVEMRRLAPLGQIVERLNALEEALRTGRAPAAGGSGGSQTPPVVPPSSAPPRRGMAGGGGSGASSFASPDKGGAPEPERLATKSVEAESSAATSAAAAPHINGRTQAQPSPSYTAHDNSATARPAATPNLKLVPTPAQSGGAPSFAGDAAARASDAPFSLSDGAGLFEAQHPFVEGARAGEDRVGQPVALTPTKQAGTPVQATAARAPHAGAVTDEKAHARAHAASDDPASAFKRGLEERGKPLLAVALDGARRVWVEDEEVRVEFTPEGKHLRDTLMKPENMRLLHEVCCEALGRGVGVAVRMRAPGEREDEQLTAEDESRREQRLMRERVEGHPVVQKMLKTFRAEIVEVRRTDDAPSPHHQ